MKEGGNEEGRACHRIAENHAWVTYAARACVRMCVRHLQARQGDVEGSRVSKSHGNKTKRR